MRRSKNDKLVSILVILLLGITLGYAYLNTELQINGTTNISSANWNIYWNNIQYGTNNVTDVTTPATISQGLTEVTFNVNFKEPGDTYEFTVDAVNDGSIDAMIDTFSKGVYASNGTTPKTLPDYLEYTVTYSDGMPIAVNHLLEAGKTETYKVRVHYKEDITFSQLPSANDNYMFKFSITYAQANSSAIPAPHPTSFANDDWSTIVMAVQTDNTSAYHVGDTKTVDMGSLGTHTIRIANTSTPAECATEGFSQTACGFVLEFADIITRHIMNSTNTNVGGWPASYMRTYVNNNIYNALPEVLRNTIINTTVVSGHGNNAGETNFTSTDKIYLLSTHEVWEDVDGNAYSGIDRYDTAYHNTRQLDYYRELGINTSNYSEATKKEVNFNSVWWLRSSCSNYNYYFGYMNANGNYSHTSSDTNYGVSPAFRIA